MYRTFEDNSSRTDLVFFLASYGYDARNTLEYHKRYTLLTPIAISAPTSSRHDYSYMTLQSSAL